MSRIKILLNRRQMDMVRLIPRGMRRHVPDAVARAMLDAGKQTVTYANRLIRSRYNLRLARVKRGLSYTKASWRWGKAGASIIAKGRPINLASFGARQTRRGVSVLVKKTRGRKLLLSRVFMPPAKGWVSAGRSGGYYFGHTGNQTVFIRKRGAKRLPIRALYGPSIPGILSPTKPNADIYWKVRRRLRLTLNRRLDYQLGRILKRAGVL